MDAPSRLVLLGHPVAHSISPAFQNAALRAAAIPLTYSLLDVAPDALSATLDVLAREPAAGNITIPHKETVYAQCIRVSALARRVGAVNTFWHEDGELVGDNTDVGGAEMVMRALAGGPLAESRIAVIGAGGSASAVLCAAERCRVSDVRVYNRSMGRAEQLVDRFAGVSRVANSLEAALEGATLVVNATPVGLHEGAGFPVPLELLPSGCAVFDLTYRRGETAWVTAARNAGHRAADGEGMLIEQGALSFERWFGIAPDRDAMWKAIH
ncbi:MAG: shikimate dehydrogenase [Gemmatimonadota bacterium]